MPASMPSDGVDVTRLQGGREHGDAGSRHRDDTGREPEGVRPLRLGRSAALVMAPTDGRFPGSSSR